MSIKKDGVGQVVAPWRFLLFACVSLAARSILCPRVGGTRGIMGAFDIGATAFLIACVPLFNDTAAQMREAATMNDANRGSLLLLSAAVTGVILVSVGSELTQKAKPSLPDLLLVLVTLCLCWTFSNLVYALHYAHLFYTRNEANGDAGGLKFPDTDEPDYLGFCVLLFVSGDDFPNLRC